MGGAPGVRLKADYVYATDGGRVFGATGFGLAQGLRHGNQFLGLRWGPTTFGSLTKRAWFHRSTWH